MAPWVVVVLKATLFFNVGPKLKSRTVLRHRLKLNKKKNNLDKIIKIKVVLNCPKWQDICSTIFSGFLTTCLSPKNGVQKVSTLFQMVRIGKTIVQQLFFDFIRPAPQKSKNKIKINQNYFLKILVLKAYFHATKLYTCFWLSNPC